MEWFWDPRKAAANLHKHHVSFELAASIFDDPLLGLRLDADRGEERWQGIGSPLGAGSVLILVVHTRFEEDGYGRIISARRANAREKHAYETGQF